MTAKYYKKKDIVKAYDLTTTPRNADGDWIDENGEKLTSMMYVDRVEMDYDDGSTSFSLYTIEGYKKYVKLYPQHAEDLQPFKRMVLSYKTEHGDIEDERGFIVLIPEWNGKGTCAHTCNMKRDIFLETYEEVNKNE